MKPISLALFLLLQMAFAGDLILIRHGEADHNVLSIYNSDPSLPGYFPSHLTEKGKEEVCRTAHELQKFGYSDSNIAIVYSSPLPRTIETSEELSSCGLFSKDKIILEPLITEVNFGALEGKKVTSDWKKKEYHVETQKHIDERVSEFLHILQTNGFEGNVVVVTHGGIASAIIKQITGRTEKVQKAVPIILPLSRINYRQPLLKMN